MHNGQVAKGEKKQKKTRRIRFSHCRSSICRHTYFSPIVVTAFSVSPDVYCNLWRFHGKFPSNPEFMHRLNAQTQTHEHTRARARELAEKNVSFQSFECESIQTHQSITDKRIERQICIDLSCSACQTKEWICNWIEASHSISGTEKNEFYRLQLWVMLLVVVDTVVIFSY